MSRPDDRLDSVEKHQKLLESNIRDLTARNDALIGQIRAWRVLLDRASYDLNDRLSAQGLSVLDSYLWCDIRAALMDDMTVKKEVKK